MKIMLVAAEASGDALGAGLAKALKARLGDDVTFVGVGGPRMAAEGVDSPFDIAELSILGWVEGLRAYGKAVYADLEKIFAKHGMTWDPSDATDLTMGYLDAWVYDKYYNG